MPQILGLDIGGANIKLATNDGAAESLAFPLWRRHRELAAELATMVHRYPQSSAIAVTLTGELADCYPTKAVGVADILSATQQAAGSRPVLVWSTSGCFLSVETAIQSHRDVAAANWHGLTTWLARQTPAEIGLLIDIGSTTTDIIPYREGEVVARGRTDLGRLQAGELVYTGAGRTPLCALVPTIPFRGASVSVAAELFATTQDVYLWLGEIPDDATNLDTADGRPATREAARHRLCHMLCCDHEELTSAELDSLCETWASLQRRQIMAALQQVLHAFGSTPDHLVISGSGSFLAELVLAEFAPLQMVPRRSLSAVISPEVASAACAYALARLADDHPSA